LEGFFIFMQKSGTRAFAVDNAHSVDGAGMNYDLTTGRAQLEAHVVGVDGINSDILIRKIIGV
jgi:hypothetical protein